MDRSTTPSRPWLRVLILTLLLVLTLSACAQLRAGAQAAARELPSATERLVNNPNAGGLTNFLVTLGTAFVTGAAGAVGGSKMEKRRRKKNPPKCACCGHAHRE